MTQQRENSNQADFPKEAGVAVGLNRRSFLVLSAAGVAAILARPIRTFADLEAMMSADTTALDPKFWSRRDRASFVLVGDFGAGFVQPDGTMGTRINPNAKAVADGIRRVAPIRGAAYVVALGDLIYVPYFSGAPSPQYPYEDTTWQALDLSPYDQAIGTLYHRYIQFPEGSTSQFAARGSDSQRFLAILGDHDWWHQPRVEVSGRPLYPMDTAVFPAPIGIQPKYLIEDPEGSRTPYLEYFANQGRGSSSGNTRYWDVQRGNVHWIALSSDQNETLLGSLDNAAYFAPAGVDPGRRNLERSKQGRWFRRVARESRAPWKFVITHYPPYTSSRKPSDAQDPHNPAAYMRWGFGAFGIDAVFSGHVHAYERLYVDGVTYIVNGGGGTFEPLTSFPDPIDESIVRVPNRYGFLSARRRPGRMEFEYVVVGGGSKSRDFPRVRDRFVFLKRGTLRTLNEIRKHRSLIVTRGGGRLVIEGFDARIQGSLLGTGRLTKSGSGRLRIAGDNSGFTGVLEIQGGCVELRSDQTLSPRVAIRIRDAELDARDRVLRSNHPLMIRSVVGLRVSSSTRLHFGIPSRSAWGGATLEVRGNPGPFSIRFGWNAEGLSPEQVVGIRLADVPRARAYLDRQGYLRFRS